jgi:hypothetical protein
MIDETFINAFHMMWDDFPGPVRLIHKNRTILASNEIARNLGFNDGVECSTIGPPAIHRGCKANIALSTKTSQVSKSEGGKLRYWIPVKDCDDLYIHFTIDSNVE